MGVKVLASGIDTLVLALDVLWMGEGFFQVLREKKEEAKSMDQDATIVLGTGGEPDCLFTIKPYGVRGYEWVLSGKEMTLRIGNWMEPKSRPSVMVEIGSQSLWRLGPQRIRSLVLDLIESNRGLVKEYKVSRADLCVNVLLEKGIWSPRIEDHMVTYAKKWFTYSSRKGMESFNVGTGMVKARLYDKPLEIAEKNQKDWMFNIWGIESDEVAGKIIRVEF